MIGFVLVVAITAGTYRLDGPPLVMACSAIAAAVFFFFVPDAVLSYVLSPLFAAAKRRNEDRLKKKMQSQNRLIELSQVVEMLGNQNGTLLLEENGIIARY